jgi:N utilization substance protein A
VLFSSEVPEIAEGIVEIKAVAREPGSRTKIAVASYDPDVDPVGACVGMRGSRVQNVVSELRGEKIDIVPWTPDVGRFVCSALAPAEVARIYLDNEEQALEVIVPDDQLSLAIGKKGQNVRLAARLTGWSIDIKSETRAAEAEEELMASLADEEASSEPVDEDSAEGVEAVEEGIEEAASETMDEDVPETTDEAEKDLEADDLDEKEPAEDPSA